MIQLISNCWSLSISDLFDNKAKGVFTLLNDECSLQRPSSDNFENNLKKAWHEDKIAPIKFRIPGNKSETNIFLVQHFTNDVIYSTVCY